MVQGTDTYVSAPLEITSEVELRGESLGIPVAADLPFWANTILCPTSGATLFAWILAKLDMVPVTAMTYRNTPAELLSIAVVGLDARIVARKPIWLAVEANDVTDASLINYYDETFTRLVADLKAVDTGAAQYSSYAGIAITITMG